MIVVDNFQKTYGQLNREQRTAVDAIDGPVLVLAGPGTGKTQLLSARVANILQHTDTNPSNIVCLTFTVNAANNMRERLRSMIGPTANDVVIKTFHSLAADIIVRNPDHFYAGAVLNPISDLAAQEIMQQIFDHLPHDSPLASKYDDRYIHLANALDAIGRVKDAGLAPDALRAELALHLADINAIEPQIVELFSATLSHKRLGELSDACAILAQQTHSAVAEGINRLAQTAIQADLPTGKTTQTGKLKARLLSTESGEKTLGRERKANAWWQSLASVYEKYQQALYKRGYLDYSDMLVSVIQALESDEDLRLDLQESVQYLLIDEFQDSNQAQIRLMHLLVDNPHIDKPNIMVVGDPNQTIYGFNGAMLDNTSDFQNYYQASLTRVDLTQNYRSTQAILNESRDIITPYTQFHPKLLAKAGHDIDQTVSYTSFATQADQAVAIRQKVTQLLTDDPDTAIAVLARSHQSLAYLAKYFGQEQLRFNYEQSIDIRETSCNQLIITAISLLVAMLAGDKQLTNYHLSRLLRHPDFEVDPSDIWEIALAGRKSHDWMTPLANHPSTAGIAQWLNQLVSMAASQPLNVLIEQLLSSEFQPGKTLYQAFYQHAPDEAVLIEAQATKQLLELARQYSQTTRVDLASFIVMVETAADKLFRFSPTSGEYNHAVTLMSVHGSKGLEFDHIILVDADEANWKPKAARYPTPLSLPIHVNLDSSSDYARLLYVAMTRARQTLSISYVNQVDAKTTALPAEQLASKAFERAPAAHTPDINAAEVSQLIFVRPPAKSMRELLATTLSDYRLSATTLANFLDLSRGGMDTFIEENLLKLPQPASDILAHGNAMHAAMELAQIQATNQKSDLAAIKRLYAHELAQENLPQTAVNRLIAKADNQLDELFTTLGLIFDPGSKPEQSVSAFLSGNIGIYGKIDRIDILDDHTVRIVDYKTGKPITNPSSKSQDILLKQWRHRLQLGFYTALLSQDKTYAGKTIQTRIIQLDAASPDNLYLDYELSEEDITHILRLITAVHRRITRLDIPDVSSFEPTLTGIRQFEQWLLQGSTHGLQ